MRTGRNITNFLKFVLPVIALVCLLATAFYLNRQPVPATRQPTEQTTLPTQETTQPTQETTQPTEETTQPTEETTEATEAPDERKLVVIDPGHQAKGNSQKEPVGPGATETKAKVTSGTAGVSTRLPEYKLNLQVALKLQKLLEQRGYRVVMTRTENNVDISNAERAQIANELKADAFVRIHANGSGDSTVHGAMTICQTKKSPYNKELHDQSYLLAKSVLNQLAAATGAKKLNVWETDTMSGINWCQVPATIVEMGFMSNPDEDQKMATDSYQQKLAEGIANGIDLYFEQQ